MRIRWDYERKKWLIWPGDINDDEFAMLYSEYMQPDWFDNWETGDVYFYRKDYPIGDLIDMFNDSEYDLEILY